MRRWLRRYWWVTAIALLAGVTVTITLLWPTEQGRELPATRARAYTDYNACLLTGAQGLADPAVTPVWAGMQDASMTTHAKVSYLAAMGPDTLGNTLTYATTLAQRRCNTILAVGKTPVDALVHTAPGYPQIHFVVINGPQSNGNISSLPVSSPSEVQNSVAKIIRDFAR